MHLTGQQLKDYISGFVVVCFGCVFGIWILRNNQTRAGRQMGCLVFLVSFLLVVLIVYHYLLSQVGRHPH